MEMSWFCSTNVLHQIFAARTLPLCLWFRFLLETVSVHSCHHLMFPHSYWLSHHPKVGLYFIGFLTLHILSDCKLFQICKSYNKKNCFEESAVSLPFWLDFPQQWSEWGGENINFAWLCHQTGQN